MVAVKAIAERPQVQAAQLSRRREGKGTVGIDPAAGKQWERLMEAAFGCGREARVEDFSASTRPELLRALAAERHSLRERRASAVAAAMLLSEAVAASHPGEHDPSRSLRVQALQLIVGLDVELGQLAGIDAELDAACNFDERGVVSQGSLNS